jgi:hypothetical protein
MNLQESLTALRGMLAEADVQHARWPGDIQIEVCCYLLRALIRTMEAMQAAAEVNRG